MGHCRDHQQGIRGVVVKLRDSGEGRACVGKEQTGFYVPEASSYKMDRVYLLALSAPTCKREQD